MGGLYLAAESSDSLELLQHLLQLDASQTSIFDMTYWVQKQNDFLHTLYGVTLDALADSDGQAASFNFCKNQLCIAERLMNSKIE